MTGQMVALALAVGLPVLALATWAAERAARWLHGYEQMIRAYERGER